MSQADWPEHLRDDAPCQQCLECGRKTWDLAQFERPCQMLQPSGVRCWGVFRSMKPRQLIVARKGPEWVEANYPDWRIIDSDDGMTEEGGTAYLLERL